MLLGIVIGLAFAILLAWLLLKSDPSILAQLFKAGALASLLLALLYFILSGRLNLLLILAAASAPILIPLFRNRGNPKETSKGGYFSSRKMSVKEAYAILGLVEGASKSEILEAHKKLMKKVHPDQGGTDYLAKQLNEAKEVLLHEMK